MKPILFMTLNLLLVAVIAAAPFRISHAISCATGQTSQIISMTPLLTNSPVSIIYEEGQTTIKLATDSEGQSFESPPVNLTVEPMGMDFAFGGGKVEAQDISMLFTEGKNHITLDTEQNDDMWVIVESPCSVHTAAVQEPIQQPAHSVIAPPLTTESAPALIEPDSVLGPVPFVVITLVLIMMQMSQVILAIGIGSLLVGGTVFAFRKRRQIMGYLTSLIPPRKEAL